MRSVHLLIFTELLQSIYRLLWLSISTLRLFWVCKCSWSFRQIQINSVRICLSVMRLWSLYWISTDSLTSVTLFWLSVTLYKTDLLSCQSVWIMLHTCHYTMCCYFQIKIQTDTELYSCEILIRSVKIYDSHSECFTDTVCMFIMSSF